jgi:hypothetical protein
MTKIMYCKRVSIPRTTDLPHASAGHFRDSVLICRTITINPNHRSSLAPLLFFADL